MNINAQYKRAVRIIGKHGLPHGKAVIIYDIHSGEELSGITSATIHLDARGVNEVELTYYELGDRGGVITDDEDGEPVIHTITIGAEGHEIDITAFEVN